MKSEAEILLRLSSDVRGATDAISALQKTRQEAFKVSDGFKAVTSIAGAYGLGRALLESAKASFVFNAGMEDAQLGLAGIYRQFKPNEFKTLDSGLLQSAKTVGQLKKAALETKATFSEMLGAYQSIAGAAFSANIPMEKHVRLTQLFASAAAGLGLPTSQLPQEARSILTGNIGDDSMIARALGITNEQIARAKSAGRVMEYLEERLKGLDEAGKRANKTFSGQWSALKDQVQQMFGTAGEAPFEALKGAFSQIQATLSKPEVQQGLNTLGKLAAEGIKMGGDAVSDAGKPGGLIGPAVSAAGAAGLIGIQAGPAWAAKLAEYGKYIRGAGSAAIAGAGGLVLKSVIDNSGELTGGAAPGESGNTTNIGPITELRSRISRIEKFDPFFANFLKDQMNQAVVDRPQPIRRNDPYDLGFNLNEIIGSKSDTDRLAKRLESLNRMAAGIDDFLRISGLDKAKAQKPPQTPEDRANELKLGRDRLEFDRQRKTITEETYLELRRLFSKEESKTITDPAKRKFFDQSQAQELEQLRITSGQKKAEDLIGRMRIKGDFNEGRFANTGSVYGFANAGPTKEIVNVLKQILSTLNRREAPL